VTAWGLFVLSGAVVVLAGVRLARDGDMIAEQTGLGTAWVGAVFVAGATSLPEFLTGFFAIRQGHAELAVGNLFGDSMINMAILAGADLAFRHTQILTRVAVNQALVGLIAICVTVVAIAGMLTDAELSFFGVGWAPLVAAGAYLGGMRLLYATRHASPTGASETTHSRGGGGIDRRALLRPAIGFAAAAAVLLVAAPVLSSSAATIADQLGVSTGVVGIVLLAATTTLPEMSVTIASVRAGSYDLAVGNLLGSNAFNMALLLPLDLLDRGGPLLAGVGPVALVGAVFATLLMGMTLIEVLNNSEQRIWWLEPDAALRLLAFALGIFLVVRVGD
jgi:cation:H+ antiporter